MSPLETRQLGFSYGKDHVVLTDLNFEFQAGELLVLLGANGSGKTTLLKLLSGHLKPTSGDVLLNGKSISSYSQRKLAQQLTLMPQLESRNVDMTVWEMVRLGRSASKGWWLPFSGEDDKATLSAIETTGLAGLEDRPIATLSGGQWQRAVLARSLAQDTNILLLDEPTSGLDLQHQFSCLELVKKLVNERQLIAIVSLHDLQQAAMFADRIALLGEDQLLATGSCQEVLTPPNIERAYGVKTTVMKHPNHDRPLIIPLGPTNKLHS